MFILPPTAKTEERLFKGSLLVEKRPVLLASIPIKSLEEAISSCNFSSACIYARKCALRTCSISRHTPIMNTGIQCLFQPSGFDP